MSSAVAIVPGLSCQQPATACCEADSRASTGVWKRPGSKAKDAAYGVVAGPGMSKGWLSGLLPAVFALAFLTLPLLLGFLFFFSLREDALYVLFGCHLTRP